MGTLTILTRIRATPIRKNSKKGKIDSRGATATIWSFCSFLVMPAMIIGYITEMPMINVLLGLIVPTGLLISALWDRRAKISLRNEAIKKERKRRRAGKPAKPVTKYTFYFDWLWWLATITSWVLVGLIMSLTGIKVNMGAWGYGMIAVVLAVGVIAALFQLGVTADWRKRNGQRLVLMVLNCIVIAIAAVLATGWANYGPSGVEEENSSTSTPCDLSLYPAGCD